MVRVGLDIATWCRKRAADNADTCVAALREGPIQALVIDNYSISDAVWTRPRKAGFVAVFRDGLPYGPETISIDPNPGYAETGTAVVGGQPIMPLPAKFARLNEKCRRVTEKARSGPLDGPGCFRRARQRKPDHDCA